jgi:hypothetical protein
MEEKPKSIWRRSWTGWGAACMWFVVLFVGAAVILYGIGLGSAKRTSDGQLLLFAVTGGAIVAAIGAGLIGFLHWIFCWRNVKRGLFGLACLATLVALFYAEENWRGRRAWNNYVSECEAAGASMDWRTYIPPQIPDDQNLAMCPLFKPVLDYSRATNGVKHGSNTIWNDTNGTARVDHLDLRWADRWSIGSVLEAHGEARRELDAHPLTNSWVNLAAWQNYFRTGTNLDGIAAGKTPAEDVLLGMRYLEADLAELQGEAMKRPLARWPVHYDTDFVAGILLPHLGDIRRINQTLQVRSAARLAAGEVAGGLADIQLGLRLADSAASDPFLISLLVQEFAVEDILQPVREGIARHQFSETQLAALQQQLAGEDFFKAYERALQGERAMEDQWEHVSSKALMELFRGMNIDREAERNVWLLLQFAPRGWIYQNQLTLCRVTDRFWRRAIDGRSHQAFPAMTKDSDKIPGESTGVFSIITKHVFSYRIMKPAPLETAWHQTVVDETVLACALERYRLAHGDYPETLEVLAPQFIAQVPHDVIGGGPLKYRRTGDGMFVLYSIGWNEKDDGGVMVDDGSQPNIDARRSQPKFEEGDWVWRYPQK